MSALHRLAVAAGLIREWTDAAGRAQVVEDRALAAILGALGHDAGSEREIANSLDAMAARKVAPPVMMTGDVGVPVQLPAMFATAGYADIVLDSGGHVRVPVREGYLPPIDEIGYHRIVMDGHGMQLAIAPERCVQLAGDRSWGVSVQIPALRGTAPTAYGDFGDVGRAACALARRGADALAISPVHALYPGDGGRYSPYAPSSRRFLNGALADPVAVGLPALPAAADPALIDWTSAVPARLAGLRALFDELDDDLSAQMAAWALKQGAGLRHHALFDALYRHFDGRGFREWPVAFHDANGGVAQDFAIRHAQEVDFAIFVQWIADRGLARAQADAQAAGMAIGLIADLAVGVDAGGSDAWANGDALLDGLSIGAPPDPLGPTGQNWGLTSFSPDGLARHGFAPFIAMLRAGLRHAGALRIDHGFGLARLWVIPEGASAADGAYLTYPFADLLRIVALESHRAGAAIIGEDLGTVPDGFRAATDAKGVYGMRVLWFERDGKGGFVDAAHYPAASVAMTGTHDTATVAGWWRGRDMEWDRALARGAAEEGARAEDRAALWRAIGPAGVAQPAADNPAPVVDAAVRHVASTRAALAILPLEDIATLDEQPNLPGTIDEHPNWRRRMPAQMDVMLDDPATAARIALLNAARAA
ncbi:4-alpha-glucanotransferase [Sphingobium sp.]|uniref:4-alpha-glucanotransferase n=1 Tax=Sphingobium sp. TaxID=1912891 RepID=UPI003BB7A808